MTLCFQTCTSNIPSFVESLENPCKDLSDGVYPIPDVFAYLECTGGKAQHKMCGKDLVFAPEQKKCVSGEMIKIGKCSYLGKTDFTYNFLTLVFWFNTFLFSAVIHSLRLELATIAKYKVSECHLNLSSGWPSGLRRHP